jgi:hypothetical protein
MQSDDIHDGRSALFIQNYGEILDRLLVDDLVQPRQEEANEVLTALAGRLSDYDGPLKADPFIDWAVETTRPGLRTLALYRQYNRAVLKGVWKILTKSVDLGADDSVAREVAADAWFGFITHKKIDLLQHGRALTVWFTQMGRNAARAWRTDRLRARERFADLNEVDKLAEKEERDDDHALFQLVAIEDGCDEATIEAA